MCATAANVEFIGYDYPMDFVSNREENYLAQRPKFLNATRFAATLLQKGIYAVALPVEAACLLKKSLERSYDGYPERAGEDERPLLIPAAAIWLSIAGRTIYTHCLGKDTANGWDRGIWSMDKWEEWKKQLTGFAERDDFDEECRAFATQTARKMVETETGYSV